MSFLVRLAGLAAAAGLATAQAPTQVNPSSTLPAADQSLFGFYGVSATASSLYVASGGASSSIAIGPASALVSSGTFAVPLVGMTTASGAVNGSTFPGAVRINSTNTSAVFGYAVSASNDGNTVVVGAAGQGLGSFISRNARSSTPSWARLSQTLDSYLSISGDGSTVIAANNNYQTNVFRGSTSADLTAIAKATTVSSSYTLWPASVSMTADGSTIAISARVVARRALGVSNSFSSDFGVSSGTSAPPSAVIVFSWNAASSTYTVLQVITASSQTQSMFGFSMALSGDGSRLAISEPFTTSQTTATLYFYRSSGSGVQFGSPTPITLSTTATKYAGNSLAFGIKNTAGAYMLAVGVLDISPSGVGAVKIVDWSTNTPVEVSSTTASSALNCGQQVSVGDDYFAFSCGFPSSVMQGASSAATTSV
jgi:hypothetical protein